MPFQRKMSYSVHDCDLLMKLFYQNGDLVPQTLRRFQALENNRRGAMTENEILT